MSQETPDRYDLDLTLKLYEMRREAVTRQSRDALNMKFWPKSYADIKAVSSDFKHEMNAPWRQMVSYWEMVYGFARQGLCNADFLVQNNAEGLFFFVKIKPYLEQLRKDAPMPVFQNTEWISQNCENGRKYSTLFETILKGMLERMK